MGLLVKKYKTLPVEIKASLWFFICGVLQKGISVLTTPIFSRILTTEEYGLYGVFSSWEGIFSVIITLKLTGGAFQQAIVKYRDKRDEYASQLMTLTCVISIVALFVVLILKNTIKKIIGLPLYIIILLVVSSVLCCAYEFWAQIKRNDYQYKPLVIVTLFVVISKPLISIIAIFIFSNYRAEARIVSVMVVEVIAYIGIFISILIKGRSHFNLKSWKYAFTLSLPLLPHYLAQNVLSSSDRIMLEALRNLDEAGVYTLAYQLSLIMTIVNVSLRDTFNPWILNKINKKELKDIAPRSYSLLILVASANLLLITVAPEAVMVFAPESYSGAKWVVPPVAMSVYFMFVYNLFVNFEFYYEKSFSIMFSSVLGASVNIVLNYIFIPKFGAIAAAFTTLISYMIYSFSHYFTLTKIEKQYLDGVRVYDLKYIVLISIVFMGIGFLIMALYNKLVVRLLIVLVIAIVAYVKRNMLMELLIPGKFKKIKEKIESTVDNEKDD